MGSGWNSSDLRRLSPLRAQDLKWSSRSDICLRCFVWWLSHPGLLVQDTANLLTGPEKKKHQAALEGIDKSKLEYSGLKTGAVVAESCIGNTVRAPDIIYNAKEFVKEPGLDISSVNFIDSSTGTRKIKLTSIKHERGQTEDAVMARAGPGKLGLTYFTGVKISEAIMEKLIRKGQTAGTFKWATAAEQHTALASTRPLRGRPPTSSSKPSAPGQLSWWQIMRRTRKQLVTKRMRRELLPARPMQVCRCLGRTNTQRPSPRPSPRPRPRLRGSATISTPHQQKKPRRGSGLEVAVADGLSGAPKGMALSCGAGSSQCLAAASSRDTSAAAPDVVGAASPAKTQGQCPGQGHYLNLAGALTGKLQRQVFERGEKHCVYIGRGHE